MLEAGKQARAAKQFQSAMAHFKTAAQQAPAAFGRQSKDAVSVLNDAGLALRELGAYQDAEQCFEDGLGLLRDVRLDQPQRDLWFAALHNNLGLTLYQMGRSGTAEGHLRRALELRQSRLAKDHLLIAETRNNLGLALGHLGLLEQAAKHLEEGRRIRALKDPQSLEVAESLSNLATVYFNLHRPAAEVDQALRSALTIYTNRLGAGHPSTATVLHNLGYVTGARGEAAQAIVWYEKALAIRQKELPPDHKDTGATHHGLGVAHLQLRQLDAAQDHLRRALAIRQRHLGRNSPGLLMTWHALVVTHVQRQEWAQAADAADHLRRIVRHHTSEVLPVLSEAEQLAFLDGMSGRYLFYESLTLGWLRRSSGDRALVGQSAEWVLNGKGVANECLCELSLLARDSANRDVRKAVLDLSTNRKALSAARLAAPQDAEAGLQLQRLAQLERQEDALKKRLGQALNDGRHAAPWISLADARQKLAPECVLIEFVRMPLFDFETRPGQRLWLPDRYLAWVIPPAARGDVALVDLGEAAAIDQAIDAVRAALRSLGTPDGLRNLRLNEKSLTSEMDKRLAVVAQRVLHPLLPFIDGPDRRWTFCPDGKLWLVPWAALPLPDGAYCIEKHRLNFLVSGRDLVRQRAVAQLQPPLILADPDYGDPRAGNTVTRGLLAQILPALSLPGFKMEADQVKPLMAKYAGAKPRTLMRTDASEANFKAARSPSVLMVCTHGFFFDQPDPPPPSDPLRPSAERQAAARSNPLHRCGLMLCGCNLQSKTGEDGILTGLEIIDTDLRGTRLVMLSACDTAVGDVRTGEGVVGLRQAFHLAGAEKVVATLWSIPDKETVQLSSQFFSNLADGQHEAEALCNAQRAVIDFRRQTFGTAHPYYWAAFMMTGP